MRGLSQHLIEIQGFAWMATGKRLPPVDPKGRQVVLIDQDYDGSAADAGLPVVTPCPVACQRTCSCSRSPR